MSPAPSQTPWPWRLAALAGVALFLVLVGRFWHPVHGFTVFFQLDAANDDLKIAAFRELPVYVHRNTGGYDGLYYAQIAHDPTLSDAELPRAMDNFSYRARRILPSALAWLLGAGQPAGIVFAYPLVNVFAWLLLAALLWRLLAVQNARGLFAWAGLLFSAGALASVRLALTDLVALTVIAGSLLLAERARERAAAGLLAAAALARETSLLALAGLAGRPWWSGRNVGRVLVVASPLALWLAYVRWRVGPADAGWSNFAMPGFGLVEKWLADFAALTTVADQPLVWTTLLATLGLTVQAAFFLSRWQPADRWWRLGVAYAVLLLFLGTAVWEGFPGAATRVLLPLNLAFNVFILRTGAPLAWLLAGNLTLGAGLLAMRDIPRDSGEFAAGRSHGIGWSAQAVEGWDGRETHGRRVWQWTPHGGTVRFETWPKTAATAEVHFRLRALEPCDVSVRQGGRELARIRVGLALTEHVVRVVLDAGHATLEFSTDAAPTPESAEPGARELAFALYDLRLALSDP